MRGVEKIGGRAEGGWKAGKAGGGREGLERSGACTRPHHGSPAHPRGMNHEAWSIGPSRPIHLFRHLSARLTPGETARHLVRP